MPDRREQVEMIKPCSIMRDRGGIEVEKSRHGGSRPGAGRKPMGRKQRSIWLSDEEYEKTKKFVKELKTHEGPKS
jgi:hypothetical protein